MTTPNGSVADLTNPASSVQYMVKVPGGLPEVQVAGFVRPNNVNAFSFVAGAINDVTEFISAKSNGPVKNTYNRPLTLHYPDGNHTKFMMIADAVVQYQPQAPKQSSKYGIEYLVIGIPDAVFNKIELDMVHQHIPIAPAKREEGYAWFNVNLPREGAKGKTVAQLFTVLTADVEHQPHIVNQLMHARKSLQGFMWCDLRVKCQTDQPLAGTNPSGTEWNLGINISEFFVCRPVDIVGPPQTKENVTSAVSGDMTADPAYIASLLASKLITMAP